MSEFRLGIRVGDVPAAAAFYGGLGFEEEGAVPGPDGEPVLAILRRGSVNLMVDALVGLPFPDSDRERHTQPRPRARRRDRRRPGELVRRRRLRP